MPAAPIQSSMPQPLLSVMTRDGTPGCGVELGVAVSDGVGVAPYAVGVTVGVSVGAPLGVFVGRPVGVSVGTWLGVLVAVAAEPPVGVPVGAALGVFVGLAAGVPLTRHATLVPAGPHSVDPIQLVGIGVGQRNVHWTLGLKQLGTPPFWPGQQPP